MEYGCRVAGRRHLFCSVASGCGCATGDDSLAGYRGCTGCGPGGDLREGALLLDAQEQRLRKELKERYEGRIEALQGMVESTGRSAWWTEILNLVEEGFGGDKTWKKVNRQHSADIVWCKDIPEGCVSGFS